jgi:hypothetical protein
MSEEGAPAASAKRAAVALGGFLCLGIGLWALLSASPPARKIDGDFICEQVELPGAAVLNLNYGRTQLRSARLWGFGGSALNVKDATGGHLQFNSDAAGPAPFVELLPDGAFGAMSLQAEPGVLLKPADVRDGSACVQFSVPSGARASLHLSSDSIHFRAARYNLAHFPGGSDVSGTLNSASPTEPVAAEFRSASHQTGPDQAELCFQRAEREIALVEPETTSPISVSTEVKFGGVLNPSIQVEGFHDLKEKVADRKTGLVMAGDGLRLTGIFLSAAGQGRSAIRVTAAGRAQSVRQEGRELLPSRLEDISEEWWTKSGLWLVFAGLALVVFRKVIDRALDVLLKRFLPE